MLSYALTVNKKDEVWSLLDKVTETVEKCCKMKIADSLLKAS
jgi:hypothetical protein